MKGDISINPKKLVASFSAFMHRYHVVVFAVIILGGLAAATFALYQTTLLAQTVNPGTTGTTFDNGTIDKIKNLRSSSDASAPLELPSGRTNPFQE